ncbi:MAG: nucleotidyltransferase family protein [Clostridia bacterium]|nr:nucleotidyltransferase family protein [Clostridia bacterium]MBQ6467382.1 nucleotidyltransferase family protein [Clostridia bacterium]
MNAPFLCNEKKLTILLSRVTLSKDNISEIKKIADLNINWLDVLSYLVINKTVGLAFYNLTKIGILSKIHNLTYQIMKSTYLVNKFKNTELMQEKHRILQACKKENINIYPVKGANIIGDIYNDYGMRMMNDIDYFVNMDDFARINSVLLSLSYTQGEYDRDSQRINYYSKEKMLIWKAKMNNTIPYVRTSNNCFLDEIAIDLSAYYNLDRNNTLSKDVIQRSKNNELEKYDHYLYLVAHLYKEATGIIWIAHSSDVNLIKFCDVREFFLSKELSIETVVNRAIQYNLSDALFYTNYFLKELFEDGYEDFILESLKQKAILNSDLINTFGTDWQEGKLKWKKSFFDRIFDYSNANELDSNIMERFKKYEKM